MFSTLLFIGIVTFCFYVRRKYTYWERKKVPGPKPWPFFGNIFHSFTNRKTVGQIFREFYSKYDQYPLVGAYRSDKPVLIVKDPEFIARILVKDAKYFYNNDFYVDKKLDAMIWPSPIFQRDQDARETRNMLSPGFTSGKMKNLFSLIGTINKRLSNYLESQPNIKTGQTLETQNLCRRYTLDNVALCAFGIDGQSFDSDKPDFMKVANSFIETGTFALTMLQTFPFVSKLISLKVVPKTVEDVLTKIISDVLDYRKKNNIVANDYLQFISELEHSKGLSYAEIAAYAVTFFEDGYETSALVTSYALFNLAKNQEAQERIREEIKIFEKQNDNLKISYEDLPQMSFLNACINESMRLLPVLAHYTRVCNEPYIYTTASEAPPHLTRMTDINIDAGTVCIIPFDGLCQDQRYFPEPETFNPERFLNKDNNNFKGLFYPFGGGHRVCLGQRFGTMQVRTGLIEIIKNFEVTLSPKTKQPFEFLPWTVLNKVKHGVWLTYKKIS